VPAGFGYEQTHGQIDQARAFDVTTLKLMFNCSWQQSMFARYPYP
jgi:hypothetical protein